MNLKDAKAQEKKTSTSSGKPWEDGKATPSKNVKGQDKAKGKGSTRLGPMTKGDGKKAPPKPKGKGK